MNLRLIFGLVITWAMVSCGGDLVIEEPDLPTPEKALEAKEAKSGCTDPGALNFSSLAIEDDGSCLFTDKTQRSLFVKFTGQWCFACGDAGARNVGDIHSKYGDGVVLLEAHSRDDMSNAIADAWIKYWPSNSVPWFVANGTDVGWNSSGDIDAVNAQDPKVTFFGNYTADGVKMTGDVYVQAEEDLEGTYRMGIYAVGQDLVAKQEAGKGDYYPDWDYIKKSDDKGVYPDYIHHAILFGEANNEAFGTEVFTAGSTKNTVEKMSFSMNYTEMWKKADHMDLAVIVWKDNGGTYEFVNATHFSNKE